MEIKKYSLDIICIVMIMLITIQYVIFLDVPYLNTDEYGYWGSAAFFAGHNWANVIKTNGYFSYGYGIILSFLFKCIDSPFLRFKFSLLLNGFFIICLYLILNSLINKLYENKLDTITKKILCLAAGLYCSVVCYIGISIPECILTCLFALNILLLFKSLEKQVFAYDLAVIILSIISYVMHQRTIGLLVLNVIFVFGTKVNVIKGKRKELVKYLLLFCLVCFLFLLSEDIKDVVQENVWEISKTATNQVVISNDYSGIIGRIKHFFTAEGFGVFWANFLGRFINMIAGTWGYIVPIVMVLINNIIDKTEQCNIRVVSLYLITGLLASIGISALFMIGTNSSTYTFYGRYTDYMLPVFILFIPSVFGKGKKLTRFVYSFFLVIIMIFLINEKVCSDGYNATQNITVSQIATAGFYDDKGINCYLLTLIILLVFVWTVIILCKKPAMLKLILLMFLLSNIHRGGVAFDKFYEPHIEEEIRQVIDVALQLDKYNISEVKIIVRNDDKTGIAGKNDKYGKVVQFVNDGVQIELLEKMEKDKTEQYYICRKSDYVKSGKIIYENDNFLLIKH